MRRATQQYNDANAPLLWRGRSHYLWVMRTSKGKPTSAMKSSVAKRFVVFNGHKTSVSLEDEFWNALKEIAGKRAIHLSDLVAEVDERRGDANLSSALRVFVLDYYQGPWRRWKLGAAKGRDRREREAEEEWGQGSMATPLILKRGDPSRRRDVDYDVHLLRMHPEIQAKTAGCRAEPLDREGARPAIAAEEIPAER
jgi:predicted DNA-binding ribbon-helix-helix protein